MTKCFKIKARHAFNYSTWRVLLSTILLGIFSICQATPLTDAVRDGHYERIGPLLRQGIAVDAVDNANSPSALGIAVNKNSAEVARFLLQQGANPNAIHPTSQCSLLQTAAGTPLRGNVLKTVKVLVEGGAHINAASANCGTALMSAAQAGHLPVVRYLVAQGADTGQASNGSFVLLEAVLHRQFTIARWLLKHGANPNQSTPNGATALHLAAERVPEFFDTLLNHRAYFTTDSHGRGVLSYALQGGDEPLVKWLLQLPWPQGQLDDALHTATRLEQIAWVDALLTLNANPHATGPGSTSAIEIARSLDNQALIKLLQHENKK